MSLFENFPYTNLHELNLDWLINAIKDLQENMVISVNGQTGEVILYQDATVSFPDVSEDHWSIVRAADGTARGIMFGNDNKAYILHDSVMNEVYAANNPPPYPVTSVNGQTGAITLYSDRVVRLPDLNDEEIHSWNIFRNMNSVSSGIEFDEAGDAYIILGTQRYKLYSTKNAATVVTSVNGEHGEVDLFTDTDGEVAFPAFVDPNYDGWMIRRDVNDDRVGLLLRQDGTLSLIVNDALYTVYNSNDPQPDWVNDPTASMIQVTAPATGSMWGFIRNTATAPVGILFDNTMRDSPKTYVQYTDSNNVVQTVQLLTLADIPQSSVISVNGQGGLVVLTGADINVSSSDTRKINTVLASLETAKQVNRQAMAYNETSNIASDDIPAGAYVFWNNGAYVASQNISYGDTLSSSNLTAIVDQYNQPCGFANALNNNITTLSNNIAKNVPSDWQYVNMGATTTQTTNNTVNNRAFSKFVFFVFFVVYNGMIRTTAVLPLSAFSNGTVVSLSWVDSGGTQRWVEFQYVSDTSFALTKSSNATDTTVLYCYAIGGSQFP